MKYAFNKIQLEADSLFALIDTWAEMQLEISDSTAVITGYGYAPDIAEAFTTLVFDWEAAILLDPENLGIPEGSYDLIREADHLIASRDGHTYSLADRPVTVQVVSVPED